MAPARSAECVEPLAPTERSPASPTAAPDWVAAGTPSRCAASSTRCSAPTGCSTRALDLVRYASDASPYRLFPKAVVMARDAGRRRQGARLRPPDGRSR